MSRACKPMDTADTFKMSPRVWCGDLKTIVALLVAFASRLRNKAALTNLRDEAPEIVRKNGGKLFL